MTARVVIRPRAAARFLKTVESTFALLAANPRMGRVANFESPWLAGMRMFRVSTFENHRVFYRSLSGSLEIMRLLQGARDIEDALDDQHCLASEVGRAFQWA